MNIPVINVAWDLMHSGHLKKPTIQLSVNNATVKKHEGNYLHFLPIVTENPFPAAIPPAEDAAGVVVGPAVVVVIKRDIIQ